MLDLLNLLLNCINVAGIFSTDVSRLKQNRPKKRKRHSRIPLSRKEQFRKLVREKMLDAKTAIIEM